MAGLAGYNAGEIAVKNPVGTFEFTDILLVWRGSNAIGNRDVGGTLQQLADLLGGSISLGGTGLAYNSGNTLKVIDIGEGLEYVSPASQGANGTIRIKSATLTENGGLLIASISEAKTGTNDTKAIVPSSLAAVLGDNLKASKIAVALTPSRYTAASQTVEDHLVGIDSALSGLTSVASGGLTPKGVWNAATNTPDLTLTANKNTGDYYRVSTAGNTNLSGITDWKLNDHLFFASGSWYKIDNTDQVTTVYGRQGAIVAMFGDYDASLIEVASTPAHYAPLGATLQDHLTAIDAALVNAGGAGGGGSVSVPTNVSSLTIQLPFLNNNYRASTPVLSINSGIQNCSVPGILEPSVPLARGSNTFNIPSTPWASDSPYVLSQNVSHNFTFETIPDKYDLYKIVFWGVARQTPPSIDRTITWKVNGINIFSKTFTSTDVAWTRYESSWMSVPTGLNTVLSFSIPASTGDQTIAIGEFTLLAKGKIAIKESIPFDNVTVFKETSLNSDGTSLVGKRPELGANRWEAFSTDISPVIQQGKITANGGTGTSGACYKLGSEYNLRFIMAAPTLLGKVNVFYFRTTPAALDTFFIQSSDNFLRVYKINSGSATLISSTSHPISSAPKTIQIKMNKFGFTIWQNGTVFCVSDVNDSTLFADNQYCAVQMNVSGGSIYEIEATRPITIEEITNSTFFDYYSARDPIVKNYFDLYAKTSSGSRIKAVDDFVIALKKFGIWNLLYKVWINAGDSEANLLQSLLGNTAAASRSLAPTELQADGGLISTSPIVFNWGSVNDLTANYSIGYAITTSSSVSALKNLLILGEGIPPGSGILIAQDPASNRFPSINYVGYGADRIGVYSSGGYYVTRDGAGLAPFFAGKEGLVSTLVPRDMDANSLFTMEFSPGSFISAILYGQSLPRNLAAKLSLLLDKLANSF